MLARNLSFFRRPPVTGISLRCSFLCLFRRDMAPECLPKETTKYSKSLKSSLIDVDTKFFKKMRHFMSFFRISCIIPVSKQIDLAMLQVSIRYQGPHLIFTVQATGSNSRMSFNDKCDSSTQKILETLHEDGIFSDLCGGCLILEDFNLVPKR